MNLEDKAMKVLEPLKQEIDKLRAENKALTRQLLDERDKYKCLHQMAREEVDRLTAVNAELVEALKGVLHRIEINRGCYVSTSEETVKAQKVLDKATKEG